jgi:hypothetical protein
MILSHMKHVHNTDNYRMEELKNSTKYVDYDCQFSEEGICKKRKSYVEEEPACCCRDCAEEQGYFAAPRDIITRAQLTFLRKRYSKKNGWWRKKGGCVIPRKWRSSVCLHYTCTSTEKYGVDRACLDAIFTACKEKAHTLILYREMKQNETRRNQSLTNPST